MLTQNWECQRRHSNNIVVEMIHPIRVQLHNYLSYIHPIKTLYLLFDWTNITQVVMSSISEWMSYHNCCCLSIPFACSIMNFKKDYSRWNGRNIALPLHYPLIQRICCFSLPLSYIFPPLHRHKASQWQLYIKDLREQ